MHQNKINNIELKQELGFKCTLHRYIIYNTFYVIYKQVYIQCQLYDTLYPYNLWRAIVTTAVARELKSMSTKFHETPPLR